MLDALEVIYANTEGSETVRFDAAKLAAKIIARQIKPTRKKTTALEKDVSRLRKLEAKLEGFPVRPREIVSWPETISDEGGR